MIAIRDCKEKMRKRGLAPDYCSVGNLLEQRVHQVAYHARIYIYMRCLLVSRVNIDLLRGI